MTVDNSCLTENVCVYYSKMNAVNSNYQKCFLSKKKVWYNRMYLELVLLRVRIFSCYIKYLFSEMKLRDGCDIRQEFMDYCTSILKMAVQKKMITTSDFHQQRKRRKLSAVREKSRVPVPVFKRSQYRANECPRSGCRLTWIWWFLFTSRAVFNFDVAQYFSRSPHFIMSFVSFLLIN